MTLTKDQIIEIAKTLNRSATADELSDKFEVGIHTINGIVRSLRERGVEIPKVRPRQMVLDLAVAELAAEGLAKEKGGHNNEW